VRPDFLYLPGHSQANSSLTVLIEQDVLHLDSPLTDPDHVDLGSPRPAPHLDYSAIAATNSLGGVHRNLAWFRPFSKSSAHPSPPRNVNHTTPTPDDPQASPQAASDEATEPIGGIRATRLGKGRARKEDKQGDLVWPESIEAALIEGQSSSLLVYSTSPPYHFISYALIADPHFSLGLRLYHCTSSEDLHPSHTRNFGRNVKVSQFIKQKTGVYRSTRQVSSRIQVLRNLWRDTEGARRPPPTPLFLFYLRFSPNLIVIAFARFCAGRSTAGTTADGIQSRTPTTNSPCSPVSHSNAPPSQTNASSG